MRKYLFLILTIYFVCSICSCSTLKKKEKDSLGNFPPKRLGSISAATVKRNGGELLPREYSFVIIPANNKLRMHHKLLGDNIWVFFPGESRKALVSAMEKYLETYKTGLRSKPVKAYFGKTESEMIWGVLNAAHSAEPEMRFEYEHLKNGKPYFIIANRTVKSKKDEANCPAIKAAFSPAQCRKVLKLISEESINAVITELKTEFEQYDDEFEDDGTMNKESKVKEVDIPIEQGEDFD